MKAILSICIGIGLMTGCSGVTTSGAGSGVTSTHNSQMTVGCKYLGSVNAFRGNALNTTANLGGNLLLITGSPPSYEAYSCPAKP